MRTISVRAWDKLANDWRYFTIPSLWTDFQNEIYERLVIDGTQFFRSTGLRDKDEKEVFDGDIVLLPADQKCVIEYRDTYFIAVAINPPKNYPKDYIYWSAKKIIGNIYSNPELLEKKEKQ